ncbi:MAG: murein biosynthesis integral membrane protein MurJ [Desulfobacterales bacterium]|nr:murein biosynthesis integral membrane protein MurJ [Desulfobacterales bacterium]
MSENARITKAVSVVGAATFASRILGYIRDMVLAWFFGANLISDAFFVAFRIPNLLRRLFAEGSLSIALVPVFTEYLIKDGEHEALKFAKSALRFLSILLFITAVCGIIFSPLIVRIIAPGFSGSPFKISLTITLTRIMFPYIFFIGLVGLCMGILNALGHFAAPALAPMVLNIAIIVSVFFIAPHMVNPVIGLAISVLAGGFLQLLLQIPFLIKKGVYFRQKAEIYHPGLKKVGKLVAPAIFGTAAYQINILVGTMLSSLLPEGSVSYLYYADRLVQFPLGIFAVSTATAVLPSLSRLIADRKFNAFKDTFIYAMRLVLFITIPAMIGLIILREPIIGLLFKRGAFDAETVRLTAQALFYYSIGLWAFASERILVFTFYALQDTRTPVKCAAISIFTNLAVGITLITPLGHGGLALATSLASMLNVGLLARALIKRFGSLNRRNFTQSTCKIILCSAIMGLIVWTVSLLIIPAGKETIGLFFGLIGSIIIGVVSYIFFSFLSASPELETVLTIARKGIIKK